MLMFWLKCKAVSIPDWDILIPSEYYLFYQQSQDFVTDYFCGRVIFGIRKSQYLYRPQEFSKDFC